MPPAPSLQRDAIVDAAIRIIDRDGADGLSMRKLAVELGSKPMTLYHYVPNKSALLGLVLTEVATRIPWARPSGPPRERMIASVMDLYEQLAKIPWILPILREGTTVGTAALAVADNFLSAAIEGGADDAAALGLWRSVWYLVSSELQWQDSLTRRDNDTRPWFETIDPAELDEMPTVARLLPDWPRNSQQFEILDAVIAQIDGTLGR